MAAPSDPMPPLLPVIPEYRPWLEKVIETTARDAAAADAAFADRRGTAGVPECRRGAVADETA